MTRSILPTAREVGPVITGLRESERYSSVGAPHGKGCFPVVLSLPLLWIQTPGRVSVRGAHLGEPCLTVPPTETACHREGGMHNSPKQTYYVAGRWRKGW